MLDGAISPYTSLESTNSIRSPGGYKDDRKGSPNSRLLSSRVEWTTNGPQPFQVDERARA